MRKGARRRDRVVEAIGAFHRQRGFAPSLSELALELGLSISTVHSHLTVLRRERRITWDDHAPRTLRLTEPAS